MTSHPAPLPVLSTDRPAAAMPRALLARLLGLAALFAVEMLLLSVWLDNDVLLGRGGADAFIGEWAAWIVRGAVGSAVIFLTFAYLKRDSGLAELGPAVAETRLRPSLLAAHLLAMGTFAALCRALYGGEVPRVPANLLALVWLLAGFAGILTAAAAFLPLSLWARLLRRSWALWTVSIAAAAAACIVGNGLRLLWNPAADLTFSLVRRLLSVFAAVVIADPASRTLGTPRFSVIIAPECSGFEGIALIVAFSLCWLWLYRRECRFPQALIVIPAGIVLIYLLNILRITALILIGDSGAPQMALGGFHSQAGWIAFNAVALGFCLVATRIPWIRRAADDEPEALVAQPSQNNTVAYLLPFVCILAAGMLSTAFSSGFEWLYPLRLLAAVAALWAMRGHYRSLDLRVTWFGPVAGVLVFALWIGVARWLQPAAGLAMPDSLARVSGPVRAAWIAARVMAAVVTVPIAEELAFRGYLLRRIVREDFDALPMTAFNWISLAGSSLAFGLLHGRLWLAGTAAGLVYAWAMLRRGRIGDAVLAHATTNALLAAYVLVFHQWQLW